MVMCPRPHVLGHPTLITPEDKNMPLGLAVLEPGTPTPGTETTRDPQGLSLGSESLLPSEHFPSSK